MSEFSSQSDRLASQQIRERVAEAERSRRAAPRRAHRRHSLASRLHHLADRIDG